MAFIDGTALNVALPALQKDLGASGGDLLWIVNAYALMLAALLLVGGSLGDHYGRKRVYMYGILLFMGASLVCGFAPSTGVLIGARAIQGIGGALMVPGSLAIISAYFSDSERGKAIGTWSAFTTLTSVAGPLLGGFLAEHGLWRGVFFINVLLAIPAIYALVRHVPESMDEEAQKQLDIPGAVLATLGLAGFTYGFIEGGQRGFDNPAVIVSLMVGILGLILFVVVEWRSSHPMMPLRLFKSRTFAGTNLLTLLLYGALGGALFFLPLNLVQVQGYRETAAGLTLLPFSLLLMLLSRWAGGLVDRYGPRLPLIIGPSIVAVAFILLSMVGMTGGVNDYWTTFFPGIAVFGIGMGITVAPLTTAVMGSVPQHNAGIASGVNNAVSRSSQVLATAVMGGIALVLFSSALLSNPAVQALPETAQTQLKANAADLGNTAIPDELNETEQADVRGAINQSFVDMFRVITWIAAGMALASAGFAALLVEPKLRPAKDVQADRAISTETG